MFSISLGFKAFGTGADILGVLTSLAGLINPGICSDSVLPICFKVASRLATVVGASPSSRQLSLQIFELMNDPSDVVLVLIF